MAIGLPTLIRRFEQKVGDLQSALDDPEFRDEAAQQIAGLIESVTVMPHRDQPSVEVAASVSKLIGFAQNVETPAAKATGVVL